MSAQSKRNERFLLRQMERRLQLQASEQERQRRFSSALSMWQLEAVATERMRTNELSQALAYAETLTDGEDIVEKLGVSFSETQQEREDAFHVALTTLNGDLMAELLGFVRVLEAFCARAGLLSPTNTVAITL